VSPKKDQTSLTDHDLMLLVKAGDEGAFFELVKRYEAAVTRAARCVLRSTHAAEDAVQEAFLRIWRSANKWRGGSVNALLLTTTVNCARTIRRKQQRAEIVHSSSHQVSIGDTSAGNPPQLANLIAEEQERAIRECFEELPKHVKEVAEMRWIFELTAKEIAEFQKLTEDTVWSRIKAAGKRLRPCLESKLPNLPWNVEVQSHG
jgi:RNA polymerase sigma-70 factor (ECF subfamily)